MCQPYRREYTSILKKLGEYLGVPIRESSPRKLVKNPTEPLGNLPLEIVTYISTYEKQIFENSTLNVSIYQTHALNAILAMNYVLTECERVLNTPLPIPTLLRSARLLGCIFYFFISNFMADSNGLLSQTLYSQHTSS